MAIITTKFTIGWFGTATASGEDTCTPFNLTQEIGHYDKDGAYQKGNALTSLSKSDRGKGKRIVSVRIHKFRSTTSMVT